MEARRQQCQNLEAIFKAESPNIMDRFAGISSFQGLVSILNKFSPPGSGHMIHVASTGATKRSGENPLTEFTGHLFNTTLDIQQKEACEFFSVTPNRVWKAHVIRAMIANTMVRIDILPVEMCLRTFHSPATEVAMNCDQATIVAVNSLIPHNQHVLVLRRSDDLVE